MGTLRITLISTAAPDRPGSMQRYAELVQQALQRLPADVRPTVTLAAVAPLEAALSRTPRRLANWLHHVLCAARVRGAVRRTQPDLVHVLDGSHAYLVNLLPRQLPVVATAHDLIPLLTACGELPGPRPSGLARWLWQRSLVGLRRCALVLADSASTSRDLQRLAGVRLDQVGVLHLPVDAGCSHQRGRSESVPTNHTNKHEWAGSTGSGSPESRSPESRSPESRSPESGGPGSASDIPSLRPVLSILHLGHNGAYKNREGVLRVGALVLQERPVRLVLAGPAPTAALRRLAEDLGIARSVDWRPDIDDAALQGLYRSAGVFLFPSVYEGFGWPPLEAMACGCPVVCSSAASLPEVVGDAALLAAPDDHAALARHCLDVLAKPELRAELVRRGYENTGRFTLERFAAQLAALYAAALNPR